MDKKSVVETLFQVKDLTPAPFEPGDTVVVQACTHPNLIETFYKMTSTTKGTQWVSPRRLAGVCKNGVLAGENLYKIISVRGDEITIDKVVHHVSYYTVVPLRTKLVNDLLSFGKMLAEHSTDEETAVRCFESTIVPLLEGLEVDIEAVKQHISDIFLDNQFNRICNEKLQIYQCGCPPERCGFAHHSDE